MEKNKKYVVPQLSVVALETSDIMNNSREGYDLQDNWKSDPFN